MPFLNVGGIAAEQFVRTLAGEDDLYILPGVFRQELEGDFGGVGEGFVHEILDLCGGTEIVVGGNFVGDVGNADNFGEVLGVGQLAVLFFLIAYGEGLHVFGDLGESTPLDRKQPTSTSLILWASTDLVNSSVMRASHSSSVLVLSM